MHDLGRKHGFLQFLERMLGASSKASADPDAHLSQAQIAGYLDGTLDADALAAVRAQLARNPEAFQDMLASAAFLEQMAVAEDVVPANENHRGLWLGPVVSVAAALAVAAVLAVVVMQRWQQMPDDASVPIASQPVPRNYAIPTASEEKVPTKDAAPAIPLVKETPDVMPPQR